MVPSGPHRGPVVVEDAIRGPVVFEDAIRGPVVPLHGPVDAICGPYPFRGPFRGIFISPYLLI